MDPYRCTISFEGEAHDAAANLYHTIEGWTVAVTTMEKPAEPAPEARSYTFDAHVGKVRVNEDNGQYVCPFKVLDDDANPTGAVIVLDIYEDVDSILVY